MNNIFPGILHRIFSDFSYRGLSSTIYNSNGQVQTVELSKQPVGIYFIKLEKEGFTKIFKIQKQ